MSIYEIKNKYNKYNGYNNLLKSLCNNMIDNYYKYNNNVGLYSFIDILLLCKHRALKYNLNDLLENTNKSLNVLNDLLLIKNDEEIINKLKT